MMKTNRILSIAALSISVLGTSFGVARAEPPSKESYSDTRRGAEYQQKASNLTTDRFSSGPVEKGVAFVMTNGACKGVSCCTTKTLTSLTGNGKSTIWRTVRDCGKACPVSKTDKSSVCREGDRA